MLQMLGGIMPDIEAAIGSFFVSLRSVAIVRDNESVLVCRCADSSMWYLPGGTVKAGESFADAVSRELDEELRCAFTVVAPVAIAERFYVANDKNYHEISEFFEVSLLSPRSTISARDGREIRAWMMLDELGSIDLRPGFARQLIATENLEFRMFIERDGSFSSDALYRASGDRI